jgi:hypothetical protein
MRGVVGVEWCAPKAGALSLGSPSFSIFLLKTNELKKNGSGMMYENVAPHAWSPPNFPHSEEETKVPLAF